MKTRKWAAAVGVSLLGILWLHLLLKLSLVSCIVLGIWLTVSLQLHAKEAKRAEEAWQKKEELFLYLELLLYAFLREQKVSRALENVEKALPQGNMRSLVAEASRMLSENSDLDLALRWIEKSYPDKRVENIHDLLRKAEGFGGEMNTSIQLLLQDKIRWEKRLREDHRQRRELFLQVVLSVTAALLICSLVMHMPLAGMDISTNPIVQGLAVLMLAADDLILFMAQQYLIPDRDRLEKKEQTRRKRQKTGPSPAEQLRALRHMDQRVRRKQSLYMALLPGALAVYALIRESVWWAAGLLTCCIFCLFQHKVGEALQRRKVREALEEAFPKWLLQAALLLQDDNVYTAIENSLPQADPLLQEDLQLLLRHMELDPEGAGPYHGFMEDFDLPAIRMSMCCLYGIASGTGSRDGGQLQELVESDLELLDGAESAELKKKLGGMYALFLLPVVTASVKLIADMSIFLLGFLAKGIW